jgi:anti-sigma regulatory factor (Ser/Thr protein kinase)
VSDPAVTDASRRITLRIPGERRFIGIARLFVGGLAARLDLGYETMDDLQLALESVLRKAELLDEVTLEAQLEGDAISILIGPLARDPLESADRQADSLELERLLTALVAGTESLVRDDGCWVRLDVRIPAGSGSA